MPDEVNCRNYIIGGILYEATRYQPADYNDDFCRCGHDLDFECTPECEDYDPGPPTTEEQFAKELREAEADTELHILRDKGLM